MNKAQLQTLAHELSDVPNVSHGGCGFTARELYKRLPDSLKPRLLCTADEDSCAELVTNLENGNHEGSVGHALVGITLDGKSMLLDPSGVSPNRGRDPTFGGVLATGELPIDAL